MPKGTCFLSPHSDDIVMSSTTIINNEVLPKPYYLFTVFGMSTYVDISKQDVYEVDRITSVRIAEDSLFAQKLNLNYFWLNNPDCLLREGKVIFEPDFPLNGLLVDSLFQEVKEFVQRFSISTIIVHNPVGIKQHYDHRIVKMLGKKLSKKLNLRLCLVDDFPYQITTLSKELNLLYSFNLTKEELAFKHSLMDLYESQMCEYFHRFVDDNKTEKLFEEN